ncbi:aldehyde dehydrogenase family protein [Microbacterium esteraromaticum]|uniref:aldehyde dehydrogenase family protein n=1 Tax=Microbacterium esteraromaticum TaxID=57043 RepID=UPI0015F35B81|nr:aldehyde dehydrogenase family protein [Microbacterium esteraromaticum]
MTDTSAPEFGTLIGGEWRSAAEHRENISPSDRSDVIGRFAIAGIGELDLAVEAAREAFPRWSRTSPAVRADLLERVAARILSDADALAELLAREEGKTRNEARGEVTRAAHIFRFFAGEALRLTGDHQDSVRPGVTVTVHREPLGVVGVITPWNFPIAIPAWKCAPALAYGNTVVLKPAALVPASAAALARIIEEEGCPPGVFNLVTGSGALIGDALARHEGIDAVTFTGSESVGVGIAQAGATALRPVQLELGGKNALIVSDDADLDIAVACAIDGAFFATGQRCTASSRIIVMDAVYERFVTAFRERALRLRVGHALDPDTEIGPVVDAGQLRIDLGYIDGARAHADAIVHGGDLVEGSTAGHFLRPAVVEGLSASAPLNREEVFGPVAGVLRAEDYDHAVELANDTPYGLVAGICTTSLARAADFQRRSDTGMVMVNLPTAGVDPHVPFGGRKRSSHGPKEQGTHAREFFTQLKTAYVRP